MFYCDPCGKTRGWPTDDLTLAMTGSYGPCELCRKRAECYDVPSRHLPDPPAEVKT